MSRLGVRISYSAEKICVGKKFVSKTPLVCVGKESLCRKGLCWFVLVGRLDVAALLAVAVLVAVAVIPAVFVVVIYLTFKPICEILCLPQVQPCVGGVCA